MIVSLNKNVNSLSMRIFFTSRKIGFLSIKPSAANDTAVDITTTLWDRDD